MQVIKHRPILLHLLRSGSEHPVTLRKLVEILKPEFCDVGSNRRRQEEDSYKIFVAYLRDVSGLCHFESSTSNGLFLIS